MSENHPTRVDQIACVDGVVFENNVLTSSDALKQVHQLEFRPTDGEIISGIKEEKQFFLSQTLITHKSSDTFKIINKKEIVI